MHAQYMKRVIGFALLYCVVAGTPATAAVIFSEDFSSLASADTAHIAGSEKWGPNTEYYLPPLTNPNWTFTGTAVLVVNPANDDQALALNEQPAHGTAETTISNFTANQSYLLTFDHFGDDRPDTTPYVFDVLLDNIVITTVSRVYSSPGLGAIASVLFTATAASHTLKFIDKTLVGEASAILDNIAISEVPVPAALPLFAGGLGLMGLARWARKRRTRAASATV